MRAHDVRARKIAQLAAFRVDRRREGLPTSGTVEAWLAEVAREVELAPAPPEEPHLEVARARFLLVLALRMLGRTYRALRRPPAALDRDLVSRLTFALRGLPPPRAELAQSPIEPASALRRALVVRARLRGVPGPVIFVGDDDATSIALGLVDPSRPLRVVDLDERLLDFLPRAARRLGLDLVATPADVLRAPPRALRGRHAGAVMDPIRQADECLRFVGFGRACLRGEPSSRLFFADHPWWNTGYREVMAGLASRRLRCVEVLEGLHAYRAPPPEFQSELVDMSITLRLGLSRGGHAWFARVARHVRLWSHLHVAIPRG